MEKWSYMEFKDLLDSVFKGDILIQDPIVIYNVTGDRCKSISFLSYLLEYKNIHSGNILDNLILLLEMFQKEMKQLYSNDMIHSFIKRIHSEWHLSSTNWMLLPPIPTDFLEMNEINKKNYDNSCKSCQNIQKLCSLEKNIPLSSGIKDSHPLRESFEDTITLCESGVYSSGMILKQLNQLIDYYHDFDFPILLDLSMKHKSLYLKHNQIETNDERNEIPERIHHIFSNYSMIHNLLFKQLIQHNHHISSLMYKLKQKSLKMKNLQQNIEMIAYIEQPEKDDDDDDEDDDEDDDDEYIKPENESFY